MGGSITVAACTGIAVRRASSTAMASDHPGGEIQVHNFGVRAAVSGDGKVAICNKNLRKMPDPPRAERISGWMSWELSMVLGKWHHGASSNLRNLREYGATVLFERRTMIARIDINEIAVKLRKRLRAWRVGNQC